MPPIQQIANMIYQWLVKPDPLTLIDAPDANTSYIGTTAWGNLTSDAKWQIVKITANCTVTTVGGVNTISAVGSGTQTITQHAPLAGLNIWDNRLSLVYSTT